MSIVAKIVIFNFESSLPFKTYILPAMLQNTTSVAFRLLIPDVNLHAAFNFVEIKHGCWH